ncbi:MAG: WecB/TagA/CpsF family glycosyltransferase [Muribaculaceae bacterium]|nr:WecB/TagA/CpsF family glycosyltransferase [Muribaculaceae bacterium]
METFFNIRYEFDKNCIHNAIAARLLQPGGDYICVADGVILNNANRNGNYLNVVNGGMFSICDSSFVPLYIKWLYKIRHKQYCGSEIFKDIIVSKKYRMIFLGANKHILNALKTQLIQLNPEVAQMKFVELPFRDVEEFDYRGIAHIINEDKADIIWIALGAPKQEFFMANLKQYLNHGVMIAVGAAFKFYSGLEIKRAPKWMVRNHLEFIHRIISEPRKQLKRCGWILLTLPCLLYKEWKIKSERKLLNNI